MVEKQHGMRLGEQVESAQARGLQGRECVGRMWSPKLEESTLSAIVEEACCLGGHHEILSEDY